MFNSGATLEPHLLPTAVIHDAVLAIRMFAKPGYGPIEKYTWFGLGPRKTVRQPGHDWAPAWLIADLIHNSTGDRTHTHNDTPGWMEAFINLADSTDNLTRFHDGTTYDPNTVDEAQRVLNWFDKTLHYWGWTIDGFNTHADQYRNHMSAQR